MDADSRQEAARAARLDDRERRLDRLEERRNAGHEARDRLADQREQRADRRDVAAMEDLLRSGAGPAQPRADPGD
ncbi:hypothetical protein [Actinoplanes auranticolor]|uniref:Uncharacterized protein n=1 Tax=Actinoplanes auranticolor TaxID=47988 RepID=A0A919VRN2_9ACTN|nr:hypothetical protein [Actinoplanes auranticolor]GIM73317.1 hypothetical protein Aau02nite_55430 [Actinoplanes auranticolor]